MAPLSPHKQQKAFTITELAIVLGVVGIVLAALWATVSSVWENTRQEKLYEEIFSIVKNVRTYYAGQTGIAGTIPALSTTLGNAGVFIGDMRRPQGCTNTGAQCFDHPWATTTAVMAAGSFNICPWNVGGTACAAGPSPMFSLHLRDVPPDSCIKAVMKNAGVTAQPGLIDVVINGVSLVAAGGRLPPTLTVARTNCNIAAPATVDFVYRVIPPSN